MEGGREEEGRQEQSIIEETGAVQSFIGEPDCVMSCDPNYYFDCFAKNQYSFLFPMACIDPNGVYVEPEVVGGGTTNRGNFYYKYRCCKEGLGDGPFIKDSAFNATVWPQLILSALGMVSSVLLIAALLFSFLFGDNAGGGAATSKRGRSFGTILSSIKNVRTTISISLSCCLNHCI